MHAARIVLAAGLILVLPGLAGAQNVPAEQFVVVPLRVHILTSANIEMVDCKLTEADVTRSIASMNAIWHRGGIHFGVESIVREPAAQEDRFRLTAGQKNGEADLNDLRILLPRVSRGFEGVHVYFFHELPANSVYLPDDAVFTIEKPQLRPVAGGAKDPIARVTAHALGNLLALPNIQDPQNLMGSGTSGMALTRSQGEAARKFARTVSGAMTVPMLRRAARAAETKTDRAAAKRLAAWLAEVPGAGAGSR